MPYNLNIPTLFGKKSTKDAIITVLVGRSLTMKRIYNSLRSQGFNVTYQAVHKAMAGLVESGVVEKKNLEYSINPEWIKSLDSFVSNVKGTKVKQDHDIKTLDSMQVIVFDNIREAQDYRRRVQNDYCKNKKGSVIVTYSPHSLSPLVNSEWCLEFMGICKPTDTTVYAIIRHSSYLDRWCVDYYRSNSNIHIKSENLEGVEPYTYVYGDIIIKINVPKSMQDEYDSYYKVKDINHFRKDEFFKNVYCRKTMIKVTILRDNTLANLLREKIISAFSMEPKALS